MIRTILFWLHLVVGLVAGVFIFILCLTGAVIAFEHQIVDWAERDVRALPPSDSLPLLPPSELVASAAKVESDKVTNIEWFADPQMPVRVRYPQQKVVLVNGYTGEVLGRGAESTREFLRWNVELHENLTAQVAGRWIVSIANVGFLFLMASGAWLWWPKHWHWKALRNSIAIRFDVHGKARDWNWHNALAFWSFLPFAFVALTGVVLSFGAVDRWWKEFASVHLLAPAVPPQKVKPPAATPDATAAIGWLQNVQQRYPGWRSVVLNGSGAPNNEGQLSLSLHEGMPRHRLTSWSIKVDPRMNAIVQESSWSSEDARNRARAIARVGHTGELIGFWGQALAFAVCLAGLVLVYTGFALSWRRFFPPRRPRAHSV